MIQNMLKLLWRAYDRESGEHKMRRVESTSISLILSKFGRGNAALQAGRVLTRQKIQHVLEAFQKEYKLYILHTPKKWKPVFG